MYVRWLTIINIKSKYFSYVPFGALVRPMLPNQALITNYLMESAQVFAISMIINRFTLISVKSTLLLDKYLITENISNEIKLIS